MATNDPGGGRNTSDTDSYAKRLKTNVKFDHRLFKCRLCCKVCSWPLRLDSLCTLGKQFLLRLTVANINLSVSVFGAFLWCICSVSLMWLWCILDVFVVYLWCICCVMCILDLFGCLSLVYLFFCSFFSASQSANYQFGSPQETYLKVCFSSEIPFGVSRSSRH